MSLFAYLLTILLFLGPTILFVLGWPVEGDLVQTTKRFYPAFYFLFVFYVYHYIFKKQMFKGNNRYITYVLISIIIAFLVGRLVKGGGQISLLVSNIAMPVLFASFFILPSTWRRRENTRNLLLILYSFNCLMALYERVRLQQFFPLELSYSYIDFSVSSEFDRNLFRSTALLGHPLSNALSTSIIMMFIFVSKDLKPLIKYGLYALGVVALFCFNARGSLLISGLFVAIYLLRTVTNKQIDLKTKFVIILLAIVAVVGVMFLLDSGFGGRFFQYELNSDNSIMARIEVWDLLNFSVELFLCGVNDISAYAMRILGYSHVENWFILLSLQIGVVFAILFIIQFIPIFRLFLSSFNRFDKFVLLGVFLGISSTNNSLAVASPAISFFFICGYSFRPKPKICFNKLSV